ncbi:hypothetical protein [Pelagicoccus sp. SDUM812003]|uniref:hypothetical protein n=1 Tax=Pelagicoccus sp. SDUM812003 TaxID=3041267 RepID=UPI00280D4FFF|nr:hypothetical protein [Pelagicoccus sp. SDUM812003]MDQ8204058.1 hypothetical protein [Pelagicoccus sp. SDUM812003]
MGAKYKIYKGPSMKKLPVGSGSLAALAVLVMFGMLPFTQYLAGLKKPNMEVREFEVTVPPPQFTPPEPPPPEPPPESEPPPEMDSPPPQLSLSQLNMALNPGVGNALAGGFSLGEVGVSASDTMEQISLFEISDLDEAPRMKRKLPIPWTPRMKREKKTGLINMEGVINPDGSVTITRIHEVIDDDFERMFRSYFESLQYTQPTVAGKPVSAKIYFKVPVEWGS